MHEAYNATPNADVATQTGVERVRAPTQNIDGTNDKREPDECQPDICRGHAPAEGRVLRIHGNEQSYRQHSADCRNTELPDDPLAHECHSASLQPEIPFIY